MEKRILLGFFTMILPSIRSEREYHYFETFMGEIVVFYNLLIMGFTAV